MNYTPHMQNLFSTFSQIVPNGQQCNIDFGNKKNIPLSLFNSSILIPDHPHPLFSCLTQQRANYSNCWTCKKCQCNYPYNVPSFYCTSCDFDICQKCIMFYPLYQIELYDYNNGGYNFNNVMINQQDPNLRLGLHNHPLKLIQIPPYNANKYSINCLKCKNKINKSNSNDAFLYCSLCNFYACTNCFNNPQFSQSQPQQQFNNQNQMSQMQFNPNNNNSQFNLNNQNQGFNQNNSNQVFNQNQGFNPNNSNLAFNQNNQNQGFNQNNQQGNQSNSNDPDDYLDVDQMQEKNKNN
jgi:hypothetical protein